MRDADLDLESIARMHERKLPSSQARNETIESLQINTEMASNRLNELLGSFRRANNDQNGRIPLEEFLCHLRATQTEVERVQEEQVKISINDILSQALFDNFSITEFDQSTAAKELPAALDVALPEASNGEGPICTNGISRSVSTSPDQLNGTFPSVNEALLVNDALTRCQSMTLLSHQMTLAKPTNKQIVLAREEGYRSGWEAGKKIGYLQGEEKAKLLGKCEGLREGHRRGKEEGLDEAKQIHFNLGLKKGIEQGREYGITEGLRIANEEAQRRLKNRVDRESQVEGTLYENVQQRPVEACTDIGDRAQGIVKEDPERSPDYSHVDDGNSTVRLDGKSEQENEGIRIGYASQVENATDREEVRNRGCGHSDETKQTPSDSNSTSAKGLRKPMPQISLMNDPFRSIFEDARKKRTVR